MNENQEKAVKYLQTTQRPEVSCEDRMRYFERILSVAKFDGLGSDKALPAKRKNSARGRNGKVDEGLVTASAD